MSREKCGFCFDGEVGFPPEADECPYCDGSGFLQEVGEPEPRFESRAEQRLDALDRADLER